MREAGLDSAHAADSLPRATYRQAVTLIEHAAAALDCADFGMRLATRQSDDVYGPLGSVMKNSATFGDALDYVSTHIRSEEHTSELQSLMRISYAVFCLQKKNHTTHHPPIN